MLIPYTIELNVCGDSGKRAHHTVIANHHRQALVHVPPLS